MILFLLLPSVPQSLRIRLTRSDICVSCNLEVDLCSLYPIWWYQKSKHEFQYYWPTRTISLISNSLIINRGEKIKNKTYEQRLLKLGVLQVFHKYHMCHQEVMPQIRLWLLFSYQENTLARNILLCPKYNILPDDLACKVALIQSWNLSTTWNTSYSKYHQVIYSFFLVLKRD